MFRNLIGFALLAIVAWFGLQLFFGLFGIVVGLFAKLLWLAFLGFLLSREGQELASRQGFLPIDPGVAPPPGFPDPKTIRIMPFDAARAAREQEEVLRRFAQLTGG